MDRSKAAEFSDFLLRTLNHGSLCLMLSIGHRTGIFDVMSTMPPATSEEIANKAGLNSPW
jgi:hypothetical protein